MLKQTAGKPAACLVFTLLFMFSGQSGCNTGSHQSEGYQVRGKVTYQGQPVKEGTVYFNDAAKGTGGSATIKEDGMYESNSPLAEGTYQVCISPPLVKIETPNAAPTEGLKDVKDIPKKYHSPTTSGFTATISKSATTFDFQMK